MVLPSNGRRLLQVKASPIRGPRLGSNRNLRCVHQSFAFRSRRALPTTDRELKPIAALAQIGSIRMPVNGYKTPAATGTLAKL